jgi:hypothetical protein
MANVLSISKEATMDQQLTNYFNSLEDTFGTAGWRALIEDAKREIYELQASALEAASYEEIMFMKGQAEVLNRLINLPEITAATRAQHEANDDASL